MALSQRALLLLAVSSCMVIVAMCQDASAATSNAEPAKYHDKKDKVSQGKGENKRRVNRGSQWWLALATAGCHQQPAGALRGHRRPRRLMWPPKQL